LSLWRDSRGQPDWSVALGPSFADRRGGSDWHPDRQDWSDGAAVRIVQPCSHYPQSEDRDGDLEGSGGGDGVDGSEVAQASELDLGAWIARERGDRIAGVEVGGAAVTTPPRSSTGGRAGDRTFVIGESGDRVRAYARAHGLTHYDIATASVGLTDREKLELNAKVIRGAMSAGATIIDLGLDPARDHLAWRVIMELLLIKQRGYETQPKMAEPPIDGP
jgi:hypothetical protein